MMNYLALIMGESANDFSCGGVLYDSKGEVVGKEFDDGHLLEKYKDEKFTIIIDEEESNTDGPIRDKISSFVQDAGTIFILSNKGCTFLSDCGIKNLQFFDLTIKGKKVNLETHKLVKVLGEKIDCINKENSEIEYLRNGDIDTLDFLEIDEDKIPKDVSVFLLGGNKAAEIFMRPELTEKIKKNLSGFKFIPSNEFTIA